MKSSKLSVTTFVLLGLICVINGNLITNLLGKSDDKAETDDKTAGTTTSTTKPGDGPAAAAAAVPATAAPAAAAPAAGTTSTADPGSSCGGLKGFLHICDKNEPTEPPKNVKTRSLAVDDDDSSSSSSDEDSHQLKELRKRKKGEEDDDDEGEQSSTSSPTSKADEKVVKRQGDVEMKKMPFEVKTEKLDDYPFESAVFSMLKKRSAEETNDEESEPMNATEETADMEEEEVRRRRECGDGGKDCRRKRELVPCLKCKQPQQTTKSDNE